LAGIVRSRTETTEFSFINLAHDVNGLTALMTFKHLNAFYSKNKKVTINEKLLVFVAYTSCLFRSRRNEDNQKC
jgi:hypothetical protein